MPELCNPSGRSSVALKLIEAFGQPVYFSHPKALPSAPMFS